MNPSEEGALLRVSGAIGVAAYGQGYEEVDHEGDLRAG